MKKYIITLVSAMCLLTACYDDYVKDFDYCAGYIAYQYDLRTFVVGEGQKFDISVAVAGLLKNDQDRAFDICLDNRLVTDDLSGLNPDAKADPFTAYQMITGGSGFGTVAGGTSSYVTSEINAAGIKKLTPLPMSYFDVSMNVVVKKGSFNGYTTVTATDAFMEDEHATVPYYAFGYKIVTAQTDTILPDKSFSVVAVKYENTWFGQWYHGGSYVKDGYTVKYPFSIPQADVNVYTLKTVDANTVVTDKYVQNEGSLKLTFNGNDITVTSDDVTLLPDSRPSWFNGAKLLQERKIYLNYSYLDKDGEAVQVSDSLMFRSRKRDGITEWQDEVREHYN